MAQGPQLYCRSFALRFFRKACLYAYGIKLRARCIDMELRAIADHDICQACVVCGEWGWTGRTLCRFCGHNTRPGRAERKRAPAAREAREVPVFFQNIGRWLLILRLARDATVLRDCVETRMRPEGAVLCGGCGVWTYNRLGKKRVCAAKDAHPDGHVLYCGRPWCREERWGWVRCPVCADMYCGKCVSMCYVCNRKGACTTCAKYYECDYALPQNRIACKPVCYRHAGQRFPIDPDGQGVSLDFVCALHLTQFRVLDELLNSCSMCKAKGSSHHCKGGAVGCDNDVCEHSDAFGAGDLRCTACQEQETSKRPKL